MKADFPRGKEVIPGLIRKENTRRGVSRSHGFSDGRGDVMRKMAFAVGLMLLFATTALAAGKIAVDNQIIEFSQSQVDRSKWEVKHNGVAKGFAKEVGNADLIVTLPDGKRATQWQLKNVFIVYQVNPTCAAYWTGASWVQYCW